MHAGNRCSLTMHRAVDCFVRFKIKYLVLPTGCQVVRLLANQYSTTFDLLVTVPPVTGFLVNETRQPRFLFPGLPWTPRVYLIVSFFYLRSVFCLMLSLEILAKRPVLGTNDNRPEGIPSIVHDLCALSMTIVVFVSETVYFTDFFEKFRGLYSPSCRCLHDSKNWCSVFLIPVISKV